MLKIASFVTQFLLIICLLLIIFISISSKTGKSFADYLFLTISSGSMEPSIKANSLIIVKKVSVSSLKKGDVITFKNPQKDNRLITHRIVKINKNKSGEYFFTTKGDVNNAADLWSVSSPAIVGKTYLVIPYLGVLVDFIKKPLGFFIFIFLPGAFLIIDEIKKIIQVFKKKNG
jgi:signal peptidase